MSTERPRYVWKGRHLYRAMYRGEVRYLNAVMGSLAAVQPTNTIWFTHSIKPLGAFDTGTPNPEEAHAVVEAVGRLEGWL